MKLLLNQKKDENEKTLNNYTIIFLEKGESLRELTLQLKNMKDKSELQLLLQHIIKQILI